MKEIVHIVYHDPCWDGAVAASVARSIFREEVNRVKIGLIEPYSYSTGFSTEFVAHVLDRCNEGVCQTIYLLDVSFDVNSEVGRRDLTTLVGLAKGNTDVEWIDHHASSFIAVDSLTNAGVLPNNNIVVTLSKEKSGALLTLDYLAALFSKPFYKELFKDFVEVVSDQDLWTFRLENTRAIMAAISKQYRPGLETASMIMSRFNQDKDDYVVQGNRILAEEEAYFETIYTQSSFKKKILGKDFICVAHNCPNSLSRLAGYIYEHANVPACIIAPRETGVKLSFRSNKNCGVVLDTASSLGGGGHEYAAGAHISYDKFAEIFGASND